MRIDGRYKLTEEDVDYIRKVTATPRGKDYKRWHFWGVQTMLAGKFHVSPSTIHNVITHKTWKDTVRA